MDSDLQRHKSPIPRTPITTIKHQFPSIIAIRNLIHTMKLTTQLNDPIHPTQNPIKTSAQNTTIQICKCNNKHKTQRTIKGNPFPCDKCQGLTIITQLSKRSCLTCGAKTNTPEKLSCTNCNLYQLLQNNNLQHRWPPTIKFPDIPPITKIPDIHNLPEFIHANLSSIIKQLKHNPTQLPPDICNNITPNQALDIIDTMEPHSPIPNQIFQQYVHAVSQLSPYQHYQQIQINTTILPKNNTNTNTPNHTQETYLQVNLTPEQHKIHITQHTTPNTIAKITLLISYIYIYITHTPPPSTGKHFSTHTLTHHLPTKCDYTQPHASFTSPAPHSSHPNNTRASPQHKPKQYLHHQQHTCQPNTTLTK